MQQIIFFVLLLVQLFRTNGFHSIYIYNNLNNLCNANQVYNASTLFTYRNIDIDLKYIGLTPTIDEPDIETIEYYLIKYKRIKELEYHMAKKNCIEPLIITSDIRNISLCSGGLYDDYNCPEF